MGAGWLEIAIIVAVAATTAWAAALVAGKAGYSHWWGLAILVPVLNLVLVWYFAFSAWPREADSNIETPHDTTETLLIRETQRTIDNIRSTMAPDMQRWIAEQVSFEIEQVRTAEPPMPGVPNYVVLRGVLSEASRRREAALTSGASNVQKSQWAAAALVESWAGANMASHAGKISDKTFQGIDSAITGFISDVLEPGQNSRKEQDSATPD